MEFKFRIYNYIRKTTIYATNDIYRIITYINHTPKVNIKCTVVQENVNGEYKTIETY